MSKDMKLIMERFRKNLNEMPSGLGMGLKVGAATAAGKADAARKAAEDKKEEERQALAAANFQFTYKLQGLGGEPQYIEMEPGDIKGIDYPKLVELLNGHPEVRESRYPPVRYRIKDGNIVLMACGDYAPPGKENDFMSYCTIPREISGEELSGILSTVLEREGLWMQLYTRRTD